MFVIDRTSKNSKNLDPALKKRLLKESKNPFLGLRRLIWVAFSGSALIGLFIMALRNFSGETVPIGDLGIQLGAVILFGSLLLLDRKKDN